jgi:hypothetical protein
VAAADQEVLITRVFEAPRERVFRARTDPDEVAAWYGPEHFDKPRERIHIVEPELIVLRSDPMPEVGHGRAASRMRASSRSSCTAPVERSPLVRLVFESGRPVAHVARSRDRPRGAARACAPISTNHCAVVDARRRLARGPRGWDDRWESCRDDREQRPERSVGDGFGRERVPLLADTALRDPGLMAMAARAMTARLHMRRRRRRATVFGS